MVDRLLDHFLEKGLLDLQGNDQWYGHITSTASSLSAFLRSNPVQIIPFTYAALVPEVPDQNPAIVKTVSLLREEWKTYASISMGSPNVMLRAIILDALLQNASSDDSAQSLLALLLASALPHLSLGKEGEVWTKALDELLSAVESNAEVAWTVPSQITVPSFPRISVPAVRFSVKAVEVDQETLLQGIHAAVGPHYEDGTQTSGNPYWPNSNDQWSYKFAPLAASAIGEAISKATGEKVGSAKPEALVKTLTDAIAAYLESFALNLASITRGVEMRSRLLWWKEALVSPSARISYRDVDPPKAAPGLMAYDYQAVLPSIAPVSVTAFLTETVRTLQSDEETSPLIEWLQAIAASPHTEAFRAIIRETAFAEGYRPLVSLVVADELGTALITERTVFSPDLPITASQLSQLVFLELQSLKTNGEVRPIPAEEDRTNAQDNASESDEV